MVSASARFLRLAFLLPLLLLLLSPLGRLQGQQAADGWIGQWLIFRPLSQSPGAAPGIDLIQRDYITNGDDIAESTMLPAEFDEVEPDFLGEAASEGLALFDDVLTWEVRPLFEPTGGTIDIIAEFGQVDNTMVYAVVYINNPQDTAIQALVEVGRDDSIEVKIDDCTVLIHNGGQACASAGVAQQSSLLTIPPGPHRVMVKLFQGTGGMCFRLRLSDPETREALTPDTDPALEYSLDPDEVGLTEIQPVGVSVIRALSETQIPRLEEGTVVTISLATARISNTLSDDIAVSIAETLPSGTSLVEGSADPAPTSVDGDTFRWEGTLADFAAGISYDLSIDTPGNKCIGGLFTVGDGEDPPQCHIGGEQCVLALSLQGILLGDVVGGGNGVDPKPEDIAAIDADTGQFWTLDELPANDNDRFNTDGINPAPVEDSEFVDSVFIIEFETMAINTAEVEYSFDPNDTHPNTWNGILSNSTHDIDKGVGNIFAAGQGGIATGVGVHASAGVTFDLEAFREAYGSDSVGTFSALVGMDQCASGTTRLYVLFSTVDEVLEEPLYMRQWSANTGEQVELEIPAEAIFLTLAAGDDGNGIGCDHGVFAEARILPREGTAEPTFRRGDVDGNGAIEVTDPIASLSFQFLGTFQPPCLDALDDDDNGLIDLTDPITNLTRQFLGGDPTPPPGSVDCGPDPTEDNLDCETGCAAN